jgi:hypothetical protein
MRIQLVRVERGRHPSGRSGALRRRVIVALAAAALAASAAGPAWAQTTSGGTTAFIPVAQPPVRSITVSPGTVTYTNCTGGNSTATQLGFPNGTCTVASPAITVTNGPAPGHIDVNGANATPADGGTHWALCGPNAGEPACAAPPDIPGADQFSEDTISPSGTGVILTTTPSCDGAFNSTNAADNCAASAGHSTGEGLFVRGPSSSTDTSANFSTTVTWTAVP